MRKPLFLAAVLSVGHGGASEQDGTSGEQARVGGQSCQPKLIEVQLGRSRS